MNKIANMMRMMYDRGEPVYMPDGYFHVRWIGKDGVKDRVTSFGWSDIAKAEEHIKSVMSAW